MTLEQLGYFLYMDEQEKTNVENFDNLVGEEATPNDNQEENSNYPKR